MNRVVVALFVYLCLAGAVLGDAIAQGAGRGGIRQAPVAGPRSAQPGAGLDLELLASVLGESIDFMLPRTLDPIPPGDLAVWALSGLTALDPALTIVVRDRGQVDLLSVGRTLATVAVPPNAANPGAAWGAAIGHIVAAGYAASLPVRQTSQAALTKSLFDEMLAHLDSYTRYIPPIEAVGDRDRRVGRAGLGLTLIPSGRAAVVRDVVIGGPASSVGVGAGDTVVRIDGQSAFDLDRATLELMLSGPEGTQLRLEWRDADRVVHGATLTRVMVPPETVFPRRIGDIAVIQITGFSQNTDQHMAVTIRDLQRGRRPIAGIVLDLRGNRGGVLRTAIATAESFLPAGVLARASGRAAETNRIWTSSGRDTANGLRMVVLVDGGTASAAEVLAAALADRGRAVVIGSATFGKGLVQTIDPLPDGGELFLTWSRLLAPAGWPIQSLGVFPQICMSLGDDSVSRQMAALASGRLEMADAVRAHRAARAPMTPDQIVGIRDRCPASDPKETDLRVAQAILENPAGYAAATLPAIAEDQ